MPQITEEDVNHVLVNMLDDEDFTYFWENLRQPARESIKELIKPALETIVQKYMAYRQGY